MPKYNDRLGNGVVSHALRDVLSEDAHKDIIQKMKDRGFISDVSDRTGVNEEQVLDIVNRKLTENIKPYSDLRRVYKYAALMPTTEKLAAEDNVDFTISYIIKLVATQLELEGTLTPLRAAKLNCAVAKTELEQAIDKNSYLNDNVHKVKLDIENIQNIQNNAGILDLNDRISGYENLMGRTKDKDRIKAYNENKAVIEMYGKYKSTLNTLAVATNPTLVVEPLAAPLVADLLPESNVMAIQKGNTDWEILGVLEEEFARISKDSDLIKEVSAARLLELNRDQTEEKADERSMIDNVIKKVKVRLLSTLKSSILPSSTPVAAEKNTFDTSDVQALVGSVTQFDPIAVAVDTSSSDNAVVAAAADQSTLTPLNSSGFLAAVDDDKASPEPLAVAIKSKKTVSFNDNKNTIRVFSDDNSVVDIPVDNKQTTSLDPTASSSIKARINMYNTGVKGAGGTAPPHTLASAADADQSGLTSSITAVPASGVGDVAAKVSIYDKGVVTPDVKPPEHITKSIADANRQNVATSVLKHTVFHGISTVVTPELVVVAPVVASTPATPRGSDSAATQNQSSPTPLVADNEVIISALPAVASSASALIDSASGVLTESDELKKQIQEFQQEMRTYIDFIVEEKNTELTQPQVNPRALDMYMKSISFVEKFIDKSTGSTLTSLQMIKDSAKKYQEYYQLFFSKALPVASVTTAPVVAPKITTSDTSDVQALVGSVTQFDPIAVAVDTSSSDNAVVAAAVADQSTLTPLNSPKPAAAPAPVVASTPATPRGSDSAATQNQSSPSPLVAGKENSGYGAIEEGYGDEYALVIPGAITPPVAPTASSLTPSIAPVVAPADAALEEDDLDEIVAAPTSAAVAAPASPETVLAPVIQPVTMSKPDPVAASVATPEPEDEDYGPIEEYSAAADPSSLTPSIAIAVAVDTSSSDNAVVAAAAAAVADQSTLTPLNSGINTNPQEDDDDEESINSDDTKNSDTSSIDPVAVVNPNTIKQTYTIDGKEFIFYREKIIKKGMDGKDAEHEGKLLDIRLVMKKGQKDYNEFIQNHAHKGDKWENTSCVKLYLNALAKSSEAATIGIEAGLWDRMRESKEDNDTKIVAQVGAMKGFLGDLKESFTSASDKSSLVHLSKSITGTFYDPKKKVESLRKDVLAYKESIRTKIGNIETNLLAHNFMDMPGEPAKKHNYDRRIKEELVNMQKDMEVSVDRFLDQLDDLLDDDRIPPVDIDAVQLLLSPQNRDIETNTQSLGNFLAEQTRALSEGAGELTASIKTAYLSDLMEKNEFTEPFIVAAGNIRLKNFSVYGADKMNSYAKNKPKDVVVKDDQSISLMPFLDDPTPPGFDRLLCSITGEELTDREISKTFIKDPPRYAWLAGKFITTLVAPVVELPVTVLHLFAAPFVAASVAISRPLATLIAPKSAFAQYLNSDEDGLTNLHNAISSRAGVIAAKTMWHAQHKRLHADGTPMQLECDSDGAVLYVDSNKKGIRRYLPGADKGTRVYMGAGGEIYSDKDREEKLDKDILKFYHSTGKPVTEDELKSYDHKLYTHQSMLEQDKKDFQKKFAVPSSRRRRFDQ